MPLDKDSIKWAMHHLSTLGDSDLFPKPAELEPLTEKIDEVITLLTSQEVSGFLPNPARRFMVPKEEFSFRRATQLNILDSIIFTALIYQYGTGIEERRPSVEHKTVFSNRFDPQPEPEFWLYSRDYNWTPFWSQCYEKSKEYSHAIVLDISDFYNQISHHTIENQLSEAKFPNPAIKWIIKLLGSLTANVSRGIPVGPHAAHLLAEASLIPIDNSIKSRGIDYIRFVDDIIIFENSEFDCRKRVYQLADILDRQQSLILNKSKTLLLNREKIQKLCLDSIEDRPINDFEKELLDIIKKYSGGNPYRTILLSEVSPNDLTKFKTEVVESILKEYLDERIDFTRLRWFLRRLTQVGHPGAVKFCLNYLERLTPALSDVCHYLLSASQNFNGDMPSIGEELLRALDNEIIKTNVYFQICILSLFSRDSGFNHFPALQERYETSSSEIKREIILAAGCVKNVDWLRELKESFSGLEQYWAASAFLVAFKLLPSDERKIFINKLPKGNECIEILKKWARA